MRAKDAYIQFEENDFLNHDKDLFQQNHMQTKVTFCRDVEQISDSSYVKREDELSKQILKNLIKTKEVYKQIRNTIKSQIVKNAGLIDTLDALLCDYQSNVISAVNEKWAEDFSYLFYKNLECIKELLTESDSSSYPNNSETKLVVLRLILNNLKQQIFHISEAYCLNLEKPKCHLRYTGQEDSILFCYMGIIKEILSEAYSLDSYNKQSEIVPVVTVDVVPIIESELYLHKATYVDNTMEDQDFKILSLNLPHVSFYELPIYFQYMYHEIYHYIVPKDREQRDYVMGSILYFFYLEEIQNQYFEKVMGNKEEAGKLNHHFKALFYECVCAFYEDLHKQITPIGRNECMLKKDSDVVAFISDKYLENFLIGLQDEGMDLIIKCMKHIETRLGGTPDETPVCFKELKDIIANDELFGKIEALFSTPEECLKDIIKENNCHSDIKEYIKKYFDGLKEVAADIPMIELTGMLLPEYLIFYVNALKTNLIEPDDMDTVKEIKEYLRISVILYYYRSHDVYLDNEKEKFIYQYITKYFQWHKIESKEEFFNKINQLYKEAQEWIDFFEKLQKNNEHYNILKPLLTEYYNAISTNGRWKGKKSTSYFDEYRNATQEFADGMKKIHMQIDKLSYAECKSRFDEIKKVYIGKMFVENIRIFEHFQKQDSLMNLHEINQSKNVKKKLLTEKYELPKITTFSIKVEKHNMVRSSTTYNVFSFEELARKIKSTIDLLKASVRRILGVQDLSVWYRGQENEKYPLLPSIARRTTIKKRQFNYLAQYQRYLFGQFKFRSDGTAEMQDRSHFETSDYLALMQHYGARTNLMDWSENAFTGLYFALESVLTHTVNEAKSDAALWIFSPQLYNDARKYMITTEAGREACAEPSFKASMKTIEGYDGMIPNISVEQNEKIYDMFLLGNIEYETANKYGYTEEKQLSGHSEMAYLPIAAYTSRLNPRIKAQSGIFVAFNLYTMPSQLTEYDYMALDNIQKYYLEQCERPNKEPFLYKIIIKKHAINEIADCMEKMGINKAGIYPELKNIGKSIE